MRWKLNLWGFIYATLSLYFSVEKIRFHAYQRWMASSSFPNTVAVCYLSPSLFSWSNFSRGISPLSKLSIPFGLTEKKEKNSNREAPPFPAWFFFNFSPWLSSVNSLKLTGSFMSVAEFFLGPPCSAYSLIYIKMMLTNGSYSPYLNGYVNLPSTIMVK